MLANDEFDSPNANYPNPGMTREEYDSEEDEI
jgi:hypothetical protein